MEPKIHYRFYISPAMCYPEPYQPSPNPPILLPEDPFSYYPLSHVLSFKVVSFLQASTPKPSMHVSSTYMCHIPHPTHPPIFSHPNNICGQI